MKKYKVWLQLFFTLGLITCVFFTIYGVTQQAYRQSANDPQVQLAEDMKIQLESGRTATSLVSGTKIDATKSLSPFTIVYSKDKTVIASSATFGGKDLLPPAGTFDSASDNGRNTFTWEPKDGVRLATVMVPYKDGYALSARSLSEVEARIERLGLMVFVAWIGTSAFACVSFLVYNRYIK